MCFVSFIKIKHACVLELQLALEDQKIRHQNEAAKLTAEVNALMDKWNKIVEDFNKAVSEIM